MATGVPSRARAEKRGKPTTTPAATSSRPSQCCREGSGSRLTSSTINARIAAIIALPSPTTMLPNAGSAMRVAGNVKLKQRTPAAPNQMALSRYHGVGVGVWIARGCVRWVVVYLSYSRNV